MKYPETGRQRTADGGKINATIFQLQKLKTALYCKRAVGRIEKLLERLQNRPKDFTFEEVQTLLAAYGYILSNSGKRADRE
ncbi:MAG: hypothetical protein LUB57_07080 [Cloacibacillus porcorum]|nr:hypothetical protein [Cloacibacillus porcorum]MCD8392967.1 hypothetical protein [Cloacibacillus porcorum]